MTLDQWIASTEALLELDAENALVPHGIGGHARTLLEYALQSLRAAAPSGDEVEAAARSHYDQRMGRAGAYDDAPPGTKLTERTITRAALSAAAKVRAGREGEWELYHDWEEPEGQDYYIGPKGNGSLDRAIAVRLSYENARMIVAALSTQEGK